MKDAPFVFHEADGRVEVLDAEGNRWSRPSKDLPVSDGDHVEIYVGRFDKPSQDICRTPPVIPQVVHGDTNLIAALCDRDRTVVSYGDRVMDRELAMKSHYLPRVRHLLLEGIFESVAQEPAPYRD